MKHEKGKQSIVASTRNCG